MSFNHLNFQRYPLNCEESSWMPQKHANNTTMQEKCNFKQNHPMILDGIFWNTNHNLPFPEKNHSFVQVDRNFEGELLREHIAAIKISIQTYLSNSNGEQNLFIEEQVKNSESFTYNQQQLLKDPSRTINNFINNLKDSKVFKQAEIINLQMLLNQNPLTLRLFEVFKQAAPLFLKQNLSYLIYKGLLLNEELKNKEVQIDEELFNFIQNNFSEFTDIITTNQPENYKKLALVVMYTVVVSVNGKAQNKYYQSIDCNQYNYSKLKLTPFEKSLNAITKQKPKKKTVFLRRSLVNNQQNMGNLKKRYQSNDQ